MIASHTHVLRDDDDVLVFHEMFMKLDQPLVEAIDVNFRHGGCGNNNNTGLFLLFGCVLWRARVLVFEKLHVYHMAK